MNRLIRALADRLVAPLLLDQVTDAYERGWRDGVRESLHAEGVGRPSEEPSARRVIGEEIHGAWSQLGLTYLAARLREVQERTVGLRYTPSWDKDITRRPTHVSPPAGAYLSIMSDGQTKVFPLREGGQPS